MATFLLTWNPAKWHWNPADFQAKQQTIADSGRVADQWSCGITKRIAIDDRVFLLRQGAEPRGLVASGWVTEEPFADRHWADRGSLPRQALYIGVEWDWLSETPVIPRSRLDDPPFDTVHWNTQASGIAINGEAARALEVEWGQRIGSRYEPSPDEVLDTDYSEGAIRLVAVNAYERDAKARRDCIGHYGCACVVCGFDFSTAYGMHAAGLIHVHHLRPLASNR